MKRCTIGIKKRRNSLVPQPVIRIVTKRARHEAIKTFKTMNASVKKLPIQ